MATERVGPGTHSRCSARRRMGSDGSHTIQKRKPELDAGLAPARPESGECRSPCEPGIFRRPDEVALIPNRLLIAATRERPLQAIIALRSKMIPVSKMIP